MALLASLFGNFFLVFLVLAFVATVLLIEGLYLLWNATRSADARKIEQRLQVLAAGAAANPEASILKQRMLSGVPRLQRLVLSLPRVHGLDRMIEQSGMRITVTRLIVASLGLPLLPLAAGLALPVPLLGVVAAALVMALLPLLYVMSRRAKRLARVDRQLPDALDLICRALRAGHAFSAGLQMVGEEMADPIGSEFRMTHEEINFGVSLQQALMNLAARIPSTDVRYFVIAVLIQRDSGGNLTEVLGNLSALIRERFKLFEKVRVLAAEGRLSAWILGLLPFALAGVINVINPSFMQVLWTDPWGMRMIGMALTCEALGVLWMRQIIRIHV